MIIDSLSNANKYIACNPHFAKAFAFLQNTNLNSLPEGKTEIDGDHVYANCMVREGKTKEVAKFEAHNEYIDIQVCIEGAETFGWSDRKDCVSISEPYNAEKDILFYVDKPQTYVSIKPAQMAIFFPEDAHAPLIGNGTVKKVVVKVRA